MKLWYAATLIGGETNGHETVHGFLPSGQQQVQLGRFLRAKWSAPRARGNRVHTFPFLLDLDPSVTTGDMLARLTLLFTSLPAQGSLDWIESGRHLTCRHVVLQDMKASYRHGVAAGVELYFVGGAVEEVTEIFEDNLMTRRGTVTLTPGSDTGTVVFDTPLDDVPSQILITEFKPTAGASNLIVRRVKDSESSIGFDYELAAGAPGAGYGFDYVAIL